MKRVIIAAILLPCMLAVGLFSMYRVNGTYDAVTRITADILESSRDGHSDKTESLIHDLQERWMAEENVLTHYVRHNQIETVGQSVAKLHALFVNDDTASLEAELYSIRWQMENIRRSEAFQLENIL
ncbi:DUF4363 family protein [Ruminococcaceae bacterium OttesenSCG-928-L11]|nr:DUF4363 family protein [Ruminococcaceae bacterium OttesenSCG-928-L11]